MPQILDENLTLMTSLNASSIFWKDSIDLNFWIF